MQSANMTPNRTRRQGRTEFFRVEGQGRFFHDRTYPDIRMTENSRISGTQYYKFCQLECAGNPEPGNSEIPIQPVRIRCTAWDSNNVQNATILQGLSDRAHIRITGFLDPWYQIWGPNGTPEGFQMTIPDGGAMDAHGRVIGHARPWETLHLAQGTTIIETAQLTILTVEVLDDESSVSVPVSKPIPEAPKAEIVQHSEETLQNILADQTPVENTELGKQAAEETQNQPVEQTAPTQESNGKPQKSSSYDTSMDFLKVNSIIRITDKADTIVETSGAEKKLTRVFTGIASQDYQMNETLIEQQPLRLLCVLKDTNTSKVEPWEDETPIEASGYLKALNYIWGPTKEKEGKRIIIPGPGEENGQSRPWDLIYSPTWNRSCTVIPTFQVVINEIHKADAKELQNQMENEIENTEREFNEDIFNAMILGESIDTEQNSNEGQVEQENQTENTTDNNVQAETSGTVLPA